ncbi:MAG TPA: SDR family NAD(P)-dependent oxidoreductase, partial [Casimicrobiaceae bacterium]
MSGRLAGKTAFVTAAGQGMGRAVALAMAREGARVTATDVNEKALEGLAGVPNVTTRRLDVLDDAAVESTLKSMGALDILFNCAGYVHHGSILECSAKDWEFSMNLNVRSMYVACRAAIPAMLDRFAAEGKWASIINMAS